MKLYTCSHCKNLLYFENNVCLVCGHSVGFDPETLSMITLMDRPAGTRAPLADIRNKRRLYRWCANATHGTCNWLIPHKDPSQFCTACRLNRTIPQLTSNENLSRWRRIEIAKHRLVYSLLRLGLPVNPQLAPAESHLQPTPLRSAASNQPVVQDQALPSPVAAPAQPIGIAFDFMADLSPENRVMTGHANGVITLNIEEADEAERVRNKQDLGEKYRTLLGHFRHEIGHYYWDVLIKDSPLLPGYRALFGDDSQDYGEALQQYYAQGAPADWAEHFISPYASAHPWEDWAETWSHYMHMMDTLETAYAFGIGIHTDKKSNIAADIRRDPYEVADFNSILNMWLPLTFAVNSLNRSMGHADFYPFVISPAVADKLKFIHDSVRGTASPAIPIPGTQVPGIGIN